jgi:3-methyladenine DNA glycosylase AlkD
MADTRRIVNALVKRHDLGDAEASDYLQLAHQCFAQPFSEDKLAGVLLLAEHGLATLRVEHVDALAQPLAEGFIADWNVCDWYCVKTLGPFVAAGPGVESRARAIASWVTAPALWQRRAGVVTFVNHAATEPELFPGFTDLLIEICEVNAGDQARWSQTSVGWLLRELSRERPTLVHDFIASEPQLSSEARRNAIKYLDSDPH